MGRNREVMKQAANHVRHYVESAVRDAEHTIVRASSARLGSAPGSPVDTGELRGSLRITLKSPSTEQPKQSTFYPIPGAAEADAALEDFTLGDLIWNTWIARHGNIIEGGRRLSSKGSMIGSDQAPDGFVHLAADEAVSRLDRFAGRYAGEGQ